MWVVRGPFDGDEGQDLTTETYKLLKSGKRYVLGRKDTDLLVQNKRISREHLTFNISEFPTSRVDDPTFKPKVRLQNPRNKPITIQRGVHVITLDSSSSTELWDGDTIQLVGGITSVISWYPLCCRVPSSFVVDKESCANIGVHVVHSSCPEVTHNVVQELTFTPSCLLSLLNSKVVTPKWFAEVIRIGAEGNRSSILEQHFELPDTFSYLPAVSSDLPSMLSSTDFWTNGASRRGILDDYRFVIFTRNSENVEEFQSIISSCGGGYERFPVDSGKTRLHRRLSADKDKRRKVVVVDDEVKTSVTSDLWNELIDEAKMFESTICSRERVLETVVIGGPSLLGNHLASPAAEVSSQLNEGPLHGQAEGSLGLKKLTRRTTPSTNSPIDRERSAEAEQPQVRRVLTRRVKAGSVPPAADDLGTLDGSNHAREDSAPPIGIDTNIPLLPRPPRPLKRRAGTAAPESMLQSINELGPSSVEPPLKKFKALFEESDPDRLTLSLPSDSLDITQESQLLSLQTDNSSVQEKRRRITEGGEGYTAVGNRGTKRRVGTEDAGDGPSPSDSMEQENSTRPLKRRVVEVTSRSTAETNSQHSQTNGGTKLSEPDTDKRFLTALASMKRGKRSEDSFDREFNDLRISKPDIEQGVIEQEWDLLDGLDDEHNVRGNFMLVVELEVRKKGGAAGTGTTRTGRIDWEGKPDFKKFRKKNDPRRRPAVELVMNQGNDYGVGPAYWEDDPDPAQVDEFLGYSQVSSKTRVHQPPIQNSDDEDQFPVRPPTQTPTRTTKGKIQGPRQENPEPLFLSSEDEEGVGATKCGESEDRDEGTETLRSASSSRKPRVRLGQAQRVVTVVDDDDSDDGTTFKGFGTKPRPSRR